ncbi:MAG: hypothetical protein RIM99_04075 [Cyclobacteriaceae bacterium]
MKKKYLAIIFALMAIGIKTNAQEANSATVGLGLGLEYGGIGGQLAYQADDQFGVFVGLGTALASTGYNVGLIYLLKGKSKERFFLEAMYGYNGVIIVDDPVGGDIRKTYYGPSFGGGVNLDNKGGNSFWHFAVLIPIRSSAYRDQWNAIKNNPDFETSISLPFTVSIGINFRL